MQELLEQLGLNKTEIEVYLKIVELGKTTPSRVARLTNINRTTVYSAASELVKAGIIEEDIGGKSLYLTARPEGLREIIERGKRELEKKQRVVQKAVEELSQVASRSHYSVPKIRFVEDRDFEDYLYKQLPIWNKNMIKVDTTWWGFHDHSFPEHYSEWIEHYWDVSPEAIDLKSWSNESETEAKMAQKGYERRHVKHWNKDTEFNGTVWIVGDYVLLLQTRERPHYMTEINDKILAHNMREYFKNTWELIKK